MTVGALERRGVEVEALVLNDFAGATHAERTTPAALAEMIDPPVYTPPTVDDENSADALDFKQPAAAVDLVRNNLPPSLLFGEQEPPTDGG